jgi:hypothetical protein
MYLLVTYEPGGNSYRLYDGQEEAYVAAQEHLEISEETQELGVVDEFGYMTDLIHLGDWGMKVLTNEDLYGATP